LIKIPLKKGRLKSLFWQSINQINCLFSYFAWPKSKQAKLRGPKVVQEISHNIYFLLRLDLADEDGKLKVIVFNIFYENNFNGYFLSYLGLISIKSSYLESTFDASC